MNSFNQNETIKGEKMRYVVDISQEQSEKINSLITAGKYQTVAQFISTSLENQIYIEQTETVHKSETINVKKKFHDKGGHYEEDVEIYLPSILDSSPKLVEAPSFSQLVCSLQKVSQEKCWLWGQVNKVFPIKLGLRVLLASLKDDQWIELEAYREKAADVALAYGNKIRKHEDSQFKKRDERISAGLPHGSNDEKEKWIDVGSKARYKSHFLAYMRRDGKLEGAMPFLRFVNLKKDEKNTILIGLTEAGLSFARLDNPVIDNNDFENGFSEKETDFYLNHILKYVNGESGAIKWLLTVISKGINDRGSINKALKSEMSTAWENSSDAVINTQRAGLMARMSELGLLEKEKNGVNVKYGMSKYGKNFMGRK
ncbi:MAG: hypothetical protein PHX20_01110 [Candidatus Omnitrophica bacterium]|nr:hypothetical protein [Candidatus Omnitrophota bacterium]